MKKTIWAGLATGLFLLAMDGVASALTITNDHIDILINNTNKTYTSTFDIKASPYSFKPGAPGSVGVDILTFAQLEVWAYDNEKDDPAEKYKVAIDLGPDLANQSMGSSTFSKVKEIAITSYLQPDGLISVTISRQAGDFMLAREVLNFDFTAYQSPQNRPGAAPVPEPATMLLFGIGLAGFASFLRRKKMN